MWQRTRMYFQVWIVSYGLGSRKSYLLPNPSEWMCMLYMYAHICMYKGMHYLDVNSPKTLFFFFLCYVITIIKIYAILLLRNILHRYKVHKLKISKGNSVLEFKCHRYLSSMHLFLILHPCFYLLSFDFS